MGEFVKVAAASEIPPGEMTIVDVDGREIAIANLNGEFGGHEPPLTWKIW